jgi:threonine synthase
MSSATLPEHASFVTHLECAYTGEQFEPDRLYGLSPAGKPLSVKVDLDGIANAVTKEDLASRESGMWRYREFLPLRRTEDVVALGESETPLVSLPRLSEELGTAEILVKDEGRLPTGSFKARGPAMAVSMAKALGLVKLAMPSNGNAGAALAAYVRTLNEGLVSPDEQAVFFNCGSGLKYPIPPAERRIDHTQPIDWDARVAA